MLIRADESEIIFQAETQNDAFEIGSVSNSPPSHKYFVAECVEGLVQLRIRFKNIEEKISMPDRGAGGRGGVPPCNESECKEAKCCSVDLKPL